MYLLLILYSIINLNVVSWGTREVVAKKTKKEMEAEKKEVEEAAKKAKQKSLLGFLQGNAGSSNDEEGSIDISVAGLFRCLLCTHGKTSDEKAQLIHIADSLDTLKKKLESLERHVDPHAHHGRRRTASTGSKDHHLGSVAEVASEQDRWEFSAVKNFPTTTSSSHFSEESESEGSTVPRDERDFLTNPFWIEDPELKKGEVDFLSSAEIQFWKDLIDKYLYPIDQDKEEQVSVCVFASIHLDLTANFPPPGTYCGWFERLKKLVSVRFLYD